MIFLIFAGIIFIIFLPALVLYGGAALLEWTLRYQEDQWQVEYRRQAFQQLREADKEIFEGRS